ncbi:MAG: sulfotransferase [Candidatus Krumholzibacteriia bacterium]
MSTDNQSPIFVVGLPRSGTTLMRMMLCCHPRIAIAPETNFLNSWILLYGHLDPAVDRDFELFWSHYSAAKDLPSFGLEPAAVRARIDAAPERSWKAVFQAVCEAYAERNRKERWGEKTPRHADFMENLLDWFPEARIVFMLRDPRAVTSSILAKNWSRSSVFPFAHARRWRRSAVALQTLAAGGRIFVAPYERLVTDAEGLLRDVCRFVGEDFHPEMITRSRAAEYRLYPDDPASNTGQNVLKPLNPASLHKWRTQLKPDQVAFIEHEAGASMAGFGYERVTGGLTLRQRLVLGLHQALFPLESVRRLPWGKVFRGKGKTLVMRMFR